MKRIYNFNSGPAVLPVEVLEEASRGVLELGRSGVSILEIGHRGKDYEAIHQDARDRLLRLMNLSELDYEVLFLGGGASMQFAMVPLNFLSSDRTAEYLHTGEWSGKAMAEARKFGGVRVAGSSEADRFDRLPMEWKFSPDAAYVHITTNNTIEGTQWKDTPEVPAGVAYFADASSDILGVERDYSRFDLIYAGAQKNLGPAGVTVVVLKKSLLPKIPSTIPSIWSYAVHSKAGALYNTPPVFAVYVMGLNLKWLESQGGVSEVVQRNSRKAALVYEALDAFPGVYEPTVKVKEHRSAMNITFRLLDTNREADFLSGAQALGMDGLKGHRSVGGFRASLYNAFPEEGAQVLADYLRRFAGR
ncbi:MAG: 3-phosphoserine/phosphohydroxythreonine transaminase [Bdellovibrionales bacterium]|nr:3-phosphoserine/phosphohydroxythreonine transaminase [Bdellovibrionales bacterium]